MLPLLCEYALVFAPLTIIIFLMLFFSLSQLKMVTERFSKKKLNLLQHYQALYVLL